MNYLFTNGRPGIHTEISFINSPLLREKGDPIIVCDSDKAFHGFPVDLNIPILLGTMSF
jgi:hypothetical protein